MNKADQLEFMTLHTKYSNFQDHQNSEDFQNYKKIIDKDLECLEFEIRKFEHDPQRVKEILKIYLIYISNRFEDGDDGKEFCNRGRGLSAAI